MNFLGRRSASLRHSHRGLRLRQHRVGDRGRDRLRLLGKAQNGHDDEEKREIAKGEDPRDQRQPLGRLLRAEIAEPDADRDEDPEEKAEGRAVLRRLDDRPVEPGNEHEHHDRRKQDDDAHELVGDRAQHGVERQQIPFRHDMRRRRQRIGGNRIVGVEQIIGNVEHEPRIENEKHRQAEDVLDRGVGRERDGVALKVFHLDAVRVVLPGDMERPDMKPDERRDDERHEIVQREESGQRRTADGESAPQPMGDRVADERDRRGQVGDDRRAGKAHPAPWQNIAEKGRRHHQHVDDDADDPQEFARRLEGAVIEGAGHMHVAGEEEQRRAVAVQIADQPAVIDVPHDVVDRGERLVRRWDIVHGEHNAGQDLRDQHEGQNRAEGPHVVKIARHRIGDERGMSQAEQREARFKPFPDRAFGNVGRGAAHMVDL